MTRSLARLLGRWDITPDERLAMRFDESVALVDLRRIELICLLGLASDGLQLLSGPTILAVLIATPMEIVFLVGSRVMLSVRSRRWQAAFVAVCIILSLLDRIWSTKVFGATGHVTPAYPYLLLTLSLLFIFPPRLFAILNVTMLAIYCAVIARLPVPASELGRAFTAVIAIALICQAAVWLIYGSRRSDHEQRLLIRDQHRLLTAQNHEMDELIAITAHDLRSPLLGLRNLLDLTTRRAAQEPDLPMRAIHDGIFSLDAMIALVTRLLDAHAAEHDSIGDQECEDPAPHLLTAARRIGPLAEAEDVRLRVDLPDAPVAIWFDHGALGQILDNLLDNAVRYGPQGGTVTLSCVRIDRTVRIAVEDEGSGIAPDDCAAIFQKFRRGAKSSATGKPGAGMGLFIAATLAKRMGATLEYRSSDGAGSIFELSLPSA